MRANRRQLWVGAVLVVIGVVGGAIAGADDCSVGPGQEGGCSLYEYPDSGRYTREGCQDGHVSCWDCWRDCGGGNDMTCTCTATFCQCTLASGQHVFYYI